MKTQIQVSHKWQTTLIATIICIGLCFTNNAHAQVHEEHHQEITQKNTLEPYEGKVVHHFKNSRKNILMFSLGYTYVPKGAALYHHESDGLFIPSIGLDFKRRINHKLALAVFTDWEMDHYILRHKEFDRNKAFIAVLGANYELKDGFGLFAGLGQEFEQEKNLLVARIGLEYGYEVGDNFIFVSSVFYDWKESYKTYSFSLGMSYKF